MKTGDAIAEILKREGVEWIIGYPVNHILEHGAAAGIRPIIVRQERIGLHMADAIARVTSGKKVGMFVMQHGPGAENAYGGVAQAYSESVPILVMPMGYAQRIAWVDRNFFSSVVDEEHHQVGRAGDLGQGAAECDAARVPAPALRPRRARCWSRCRTICGPRSAILKAYVCPKHDPHRHRPGRRARGGQDAGRGQAARDLRRHRACIGPRPGRAQGAGRAAGHPGDDQPRRQERLSGAPPAVAGLRRPRHPADGAHLPRQVGPDPRHRLLVHGDQLRRQDADGREDHPGDARSLRHQQGHPRRARRRG